MTLDIFTRAVVTFNGRYGTDNCTNLSAELFKIERSERKKGRNSKIKGHFLAGTPLAKDDTVKKRFTHKELTLVLGIFVALITAATIWSSIQHADSYSGSLQVAPKATLPYAVELIKKSAYLIP